MVARKLGLGSEQNKSNKKKKVTATTKKILFCPVKMVKKNGHKANEKQLLLTSLGMVTCVVSVPSSPKDMP